MRALILSLALILNVARAAPPVKPVPAPAVTAPAKLSAPGAAAAPGAGVDAAAAAAVAQEKPPAPEDPEFHQKLNQMLGRIETSTKIIRRQILENQSAPFLANLYMQLGDLLAQKSNVLYYLQMEHDKNTDLSVKETKRFSPVIASEREAIAVFDQIVKEFPKFDQIDKVMYRLAVAYKAIDEGAQFVDVAEKLVASHPESPEVARVRLLLGQHFYDQQDFDAARKHLAAVEATGKPFERGAARYRLGLIEIQREKFAGALHYFELVATDDELREDDNPAAVSLKTKSTKNNIKREALIDSVRAYTEVFTNGGDAIAYYQRVAPTETLFQDAIEKLGFRYVFLKKYALAVRLLRTLSERIADVQKIMNIYHEVLQLIPVNDRITLPVAELQFVMDKYNYWSTHFELTPELRKTSQEFFETQLRELGTRSHDYAKIEKDPKRRADLFARAKGFYQLYLGYFHRDQRSVKMATNLADVYFNLGDYLNSASYYSRIFDGEFGPPAPKETLIQNAILALQKPSDYSFYEQLRSKGLLVRSIRAYQAYNPLKKRDPSLNFALAKTTYEQGLYKKALPDLLAFMKAYPDAPEVASAAELVLNYYNVRSDFKGLVKSSERMLALKPREPELGRRLASVREKALVKRLDEQMKSTKGFDQFAQGKSYLQSALTTGDASLRSAAFEQALGRSKAERDIETFLKTAFAMAKAETQPQKRADLLNSMADETLAISRFYITLKIWGRILSDAKVTPAAKTTALDKMVKLAVLLHDLDQLGALLNSPLAPQLPVDTVKSARQVISGVLDSPTPVSEALVQALVRRAEDDEDWLTLFKAQGKVSAPTRATIVKRVRARCANGGTTGLCRWSRLDGALADLAKFKTELGQTPTTVAMVGPAAEKLNAQAEKLKALRGGGDAQLDVVVALGVADAFDAFGKFLDRAAAANAEVAPILKAKVTESTQSAKESRDSCKEIIRSAALISPVNAACASGRTPGLLEALRWPPGPALSAPTSDPRGPAIDTLQKKVFVDRKDWKPYFDLAELYLNQRLYQHAAATAGFGKSAFPQDQEEFNAITGCAVLRMGLFSEASFYLDKASELNGHKATCQGQLRTRISSGAQGA